MTAPVHDEPGPGDVNGDPDLWSTQLALACRREHLDGYDFHRTWAFEGEPFDPDKPPDGGGWVRNTQAGDDGYAITTPQPGRRAQQISYWRRKKVTL